MEDLLKKLPGVEVDNQGNITAQGEQVRRVTVDGKEFFGSDPKLATKNLPADAVSKVQVFDKKSDQATFSGIDDGQREKTINLELKPEKRNGAFGSGTVGAGTDERYSTRINVNRFTKEKQLSFLGMANNTNEQGFSMEEYMNFTGGSQRMMGGGRVRLEIGGDNQNGVPLNFGDRANGILSTAAAGINSNNELNKDADLNGSYFLNYLDHVKDQNTVRENFLPDGIVTSHARSVQNNQNMNNRLNAVYVHNLDSLNSIKITANGSVNETDSRIQTTAYNTDNGGVRINETSTSYDATGDSKNLNSSFLWRHKFKRKGRTLSANLQYNLSDMFRSERISSTNRFFKRDSTGVLEQTNDGVTNYDSYATGFSYTEPLGKKRYLEANYSYRKNINEVEKTVYDVNDSENIYNETLSNGYSNEYDYHRAGINFRVVRNQYNLVVGSAFQRTSLSGEFVDMSSKLSRSFSNILPVVRFSYDICDTKSMELDYETSVREPSIQQLQPVVDNSDPINLYIGNPDLRPEYIQSLRANYRSFDPMNFVSFFAFVDFDYIANAIVNSQSFTETLLRITTPVNVTNSKSLNGSTSFSFPVNKISSRVTLALDYRNQYSQVILNDITSTVSTSNMRGTLRYNYRFKEIFDFNISANVDQQTANYKFNQPDQTFKNYTYQLDIIYSFLKKYQLTTNSELLKYVNQSSGFSQTIPLVNVSISRSVFKNSAGTLKLTASNLLNKALGVNQNSSNNYIETQTTNSLGRYVMLSFNYALNKQLNPMNMRHGGMMRIIR